MSVIGIPILSFVHSMGKAGKIYLWNPYISMGLPVWASSLGSCFYLLNSFFLIFDPIKTILYYFILHQILAGLCAYYYLRYNRFSMPASLTGALFYSFSAIRIFYLHNIERYPVLTFVPLVLLLIDYLIDKYNFKAALLTALVSGFLVMAGGFQLLAIYTGVFIVYGLFKAYNKKKLFRFKTMGLLAVVIIFTGCISSVLLFPMMELSKMNLFRSVPLVYQQAASGGISTLNLFLMPFTNFMGDTNTVMLKTGNSPWEFPMYPGFMGIILAVFAFMFPGKRRKKLQVLLLLITAVGFFLALGDKNPLYPFLYKHIYFFSHFRNPSRFTAVISIFLMYITASGTDSLRTFILRPNLMGKKMKNLAGKTFVCLLVFSLLYFCLFLLKGNNTPFMTLYLVVFLALPVILTGIISKKKTISPGLSGTLVVLFVLSVLLNIADPLVFVEKAYFQKPDHFKKELAFLKSIKKHIHTPGPRVLFSTNPNSASVVGLCNTCGYFPLDMEYYTNYIYATFTGRLMDDDAFSRMIHFTFHPGVLLLEAGGIKAKNGSNPFSAKIDWKKIYFQRLAGNPMYRMLCPAFTILPDSYYQEKNMLPRLWLSRGCQVIEEKGRILGALMKPTFNPLDFVILTKKPPAEYSGIKYHSSLLLHEFPVITHFEPDEIHINLRENSGWITMSDRWYPGWIARIDGVKRPIYRGNYLFRTIPVKSGDKSLILKYEPESFKKGVIVSVSSTIILVILYIFMVIYEWKFSGNKETKNEK